MNIKYSLTKVSTNPKTGPIPVSYSGAQTCPDACRLKGNGCYAELGPGSVHWKRLTDGERGVDWPEFLRAVRAIPKKALWRFNIAGDLPGIGNSIDTQAVYDLVNAQQGRRGFCYTHKPMDDLSARLVVQLANDSGFTINLSADNLHHADQLADLGIAPVVVVVPSDSPNTMVTPAGRAVVTCPQEKHDVTCAQCQVCAHADRKSIIGFRAHGTRKKTVNMIARMQQ